MLESLKKFYKFLKEDTWQSWVVSIILMIIFIKLIFFPGLSLIAGSSLPLLVVESCSMYHPTGFDNWWESNKAWYEARGINQTEFLEYPFKNGFNKGDIILVTKFKTQKEGQIIIFDTNDDALNNHPIIHRIVSLNPIQTKGDNNPSQLTKNNNLLRVDETSIPEEKIIGKATLKIPVLGWIKLIFFEPFRKREDRGLCKAT